MRLFIALLTLILVAAVGSEWYSDRSGGWFTALVTFGAVITWVVCLGTTTVIKSPPRSPK